MVQILHTLGVKSLRAKGSEYHFCRGAGLGRGRAHRRRCFVVVVFVVVVVVGVVGVCG